MKLRTTWNETHRMPWPHDGKKQSKAKQSCKKTGEGRGLYTHQMNMK